MKKGINNKKKNKYTNLSIVIHGKYILLTLTLIIIITFSTSFISVCGSDVLHTSLPTFHVPGCAQLYHLPTLPYLEACLCLLLGRGRAVPLPPRPQRLHHHPPRLDLQCGGGAGGAGSGRRDQGSRARVAQRGVAGDGAGCPPAGLLAQCSKCEGAGRGGGAHLLGHFKKSSYKVHLPLSSLSPPLGQPLQSPQHND